MPNSHRPPPGVVHMEVDGVLDLHHFRPREVPGLVREYLHECKRLGIDEVRIIHGKGKGVLRAIVQDILAADPEVHSFGPAHDGSGWGVTIARLGAKPHASRGTSENRTGEERKAAGGNAWWRRLLGKLRKPNSGQG